MNRSLFVPLVPAMSDFTFTMDSELITENGILESTLEQKVKETIRQIGASWWRKGLSDDGGGRLR